MVWPNKSAREWQFHCVFSGSDSLSGVYVGSVYTWSTDHYIPYGQVYSPGVRCIYFTLTINDDPAGDNWAITWQVPSSWAGTSSGTLASGTGIPTSLEVLVDATDWYLSDDASCNWTLSFTQLDFKYAVNGGSFTTAVTIGSHSESGGPPTTPFDKRYCNDQVDPSPGYATYFGEPSCQTLQADDEALSGVQQINTDVEWGWRYKSDDGTTWVTDTCTWDNALLSPSTCSCKYAPGSITDIDSWQNTFATELYISRAIIDSGGGTQACLEIIAGKPVWVYNPYTYWEIEEVAHGKLISAKALPYNFGVTDTRRICTSACTGVTDYSSDVTVSDTQTYSEFQKDTYYSIGHKTCHSAFLAPPCEAPIAIISDFCSYHELDELLHPIPPPCAGLKSPDNIHFEQSGEYIWAYVQDGDVYVARSQFSVPRAGYYSVVAITSTGNCDRPALYHAPNGIVYVSYEIGGDCVYRFSTDFCKTWSSSAVIFSGCIEPRIAIGPNGERLYAAFKYDSGLSGPGKIRVISMTPGGSLSTETDALLWNGSSNAAFNVDDVGFDITFEKGFLLICKQTSVTGLSILTSKDFGATFTDITP